MKYVPLLSVLTALLLSACIRVSVGGAAGDPPAIFRLNLPAPPADLIRVNWQLVVDRPSASRTLDGQRVLWIDGDGRVGTLPRLQWSDRLPDLVQAALIELFEQSGSIGGIDRPESGLRGDYLLVGELRAFQLEGDRRQGLEARIALGLRLIAPARNRIVAATRIEAKARATGTSDAELIRAFEQAFAEVLVESLRWTLSSGEANRVSGPPAPGP